MLKPSVESKLTCGKSHDYQNSQFLGSFAKVIAASSDLQSNSARAHAPRQSLKPPRSYKMPRGKKKADPEPEPDENELMEDAVRVPPGPDRNPLDNSQNFASRHPPPR